MHYFILLLLTFFGHSLIAQHDDEMGNKGKVQLPIPVEDAKFANAEGLYSGSNKALACQMEACNKKNPLELKLAKSGIVFRLIPAGEFLMGSPNSEKGRSITEKLRKVEIEDHFYIGKYEITQSQWQFVMGENPSAFNKDGKLSHVVKSMETANFPVESISWEDSQKFIYKLHVLEGLKEGSFCLPSEEQWEYACRAGTLSKYYTGQNNASLNLAGWFYENAGRDPLEEPVDTINILNNYNRTHEVGTKHCNAFGIFDTHGNVWEWCSNLYSSTRSSRVVRGGSWNLDSNYSRAAKRLPFTGNKTHPSIGLRLVLNRDFSAGIPNQILEVDSKLWPKKFQNRTPVKQISAVQEHGITKESRTSVLSALHWLKSVQKPDGSWGTSAKSAFTAQALLCFLANGHTPKSLEFGNCVNKAMLWLAADQIDLKSHHAYAHAIKTIALAEAYGMTGNQKIKSTLDKCVDIIISGLRPEGSFNYNYDLKGPRNDLSFASWNYSALNAAVNARIENPGLKP
ncbi:MAG: SUMF1/EgtB/PvdO family nonheme iron enzyme, partial [Lentisphaeraceae bacterium]|nr:SUMF1/EgtB/PvdO family nonheme iron enzyme [Lentisphaeraceae bacterium]